MTGKPWTSSFFAPRTDARWRRPIASFAPHNPRSLAASNRAIRRSEYRSVSAASSQATQMLSSVTSPYFRFRKPRQSALPCDEGLVNAMTKGAFYRWPAARLRITLPYRCPWLFSARQAATERVGTAIAGVSSPRFVTLHARITGSVGSRRAVSVRLKNSGMDS